MFNLLKKIESPRFVSKNHIFLAKNRLILASPFFSFGLKEYDLLAAPSLGQSRRNRMQLASPEPYKSEKYT